MGRVQRKRKQAKEVKKITNIINIIKNITTKTITNFNIPKTTKLLPIIILVLTLLICSSVSYGAYNLFVKKTPKAPMTNAELASKESATKGIPQKEETQKLTPGGQKQNSTVLSPQQKQPELGQPQNPSVSPPLINQPSEPPKNLVLPAIPTSNYNKLSKKDIENFMLFLMQKGVTDRKDKTDYFIKWCQSGNYPQAVIDNWVKDGVLFSIQYY